MAPEPDAAFSQDELLPLVAEPQRQIAELAASNEALYAEVAQLTRVPSGKLPRFKATRLTEPRHLGRKPGTGPFQYREAPLPETLTAPPVDVKAPLEAYLACGGTLVEERVDFAYGTELPDLPRPQVTRYRV
jgi:hypothetical protein